LKNCSERHPPHRAAGWRVCGPSSGRALRGPATSILQFRRGRTDNNTRFGEMPKLGYSLGGKCVIDPGFLPGFACLNPKREFAS